MIPLRPMTCCFVAILVVMISVLTARAEGPVEPLLQKYCLGCHNQNDSEAGLSLQTTSGLASGSENGPVINKTDLSKSLLLKVLAKGTDQSMPPEGEAQPTDKERQQLMKWVLAGARIKSMAAGLPDVPMVKPFQKRRQTLLASVAIGDGATVAVAGSRHVSLIDVASGETHWKSKIDNGKVADLSVANKHPWIIAAIGTPGVDGQALILEAKTGQVVRAFTGHTDAVYSAVVNHNDTLIATAGYDRRILIHDVNSGQITQTLDGHNGSVFCLAFNPTGEILCSASGDGTVKVWNVSTGQRLDTLSQPQAEQYSVLVTRDGRQIIAAGADNRIRVWQLLSKQRARINPISVSKFAHEQSISRLAMSADGRLLASAAEDGTIRTWTTSPLQAIENLPRQDKAVTSLTFLGNQTLFLTRIDGSTQRLPLKPSSSRNKVATIAGDRKKTNVELPGKIQDVTEAGDAGDNADSAQALSLPTKIAGAIQPDGGNDRDVDCYRFAAKAGQRLHMEIRAARDKSPLDSKIEVLTADGEPILRALLQAVRDSYFTFRGKDSSTSNDFRVFNWQEMELNDYIYADGEVNRLWMYPRGPDSGFKVSPGFGSRHAYFGTTPTSHALQAPCFIVVPRGPDEELTANGLPVFPVYYENDDDSRREFGSDSRLQFTVPADGDYVVRVSDARGFSGPKYKYQLTIRSPKPDYSVKASTTKVSVSPGTGREIAFTATRIDGYEGPITVDAENLPSGFGFSGPIEIQRNQLQAFGTLFATADAKPPGAEELAKIRFIAHAPEEAERNQTKEVGKLEELKLLGDPKLRVSIRSSSATPASDASGVVLQIRPGQTIQASLELERLKHDGVVSLGKEDSGRNLPYGVFVDNIGLNGLLLLSKQTQREFFITASPIVPPSRSTFYLKSNVDSVTSLPVTLEVLPAKNDEQPSHVTSTQE